MKIMLLLFDLFGQSKDLDSHVFDFFTKFIYNQIPVRFSNTDLLICAFPNEKSCFRRFKKHFVCL